MIKLKNLINRIFSNFSLIINDLQIIKLLLGRILSDQVATKENFDQSGFQVFSQWDDDGRIQYLVQKLDIDTKTFIEFGVEDYKESNTRFLLQNNNWSGLVLDGDQGNIDSIKHESIYWKYNLKARCEFVTKENINDIIQEEGLTGQIGLLHIDIDGNDYWIWESIKAVMPVIVIVEYNSHFGFDRAISIPYKADFKRTEAHHSNLYAGASLLAFDILAKKKGYSLIGVNNAKNNAYFVLDSHLSNLGIKSVQDYREVSHFRESRDKDGRLNYLEVKDRISVLEGLPVINTMSNEMEEF